MIIVTRVTFLSHLLSALLRQFAAPPTTRNENAALLLTTASRKRAEADVALGEACRIALPQVPATALGIASAEFHAVVHRARR